jgi:hypothetical protein
MDRALHETFGIAQRCGDGSVVRVDCQPRPRHRAQGVLERLAGGPAATVLHRKVEPRHAVAHDEQRPRHGRKLLQLDGHGGMIGGCEG